MIKFDRTTPSLLQIATEKKIFIVDFLKGGPEFERLIFDRFTKEICDNDRILKVNQLNSEIGQGLDNDIKTLKKRFNITDKIVYIL
jgi:hypothetical protein